MFGFGRLAVFIGVPLSHELSISLFDVVPRRSVWHAKAIKCLENGHIGGIGQIGFPVKSGIYRAHFVEQFEQLAFGQLLRGMGQIADARMPDANIAELFTFIDDEIARRASFGVGIDLCLYRVGNDLTFSHALFETALELSCARLKPLKKRSFIEFFRHSMPH